MCYIHKLYTFVMYTFIYDLSTTLSCRKDNFFLLLFFRGSGYNHNKDLAVFFAKIVNSHQNHTP